MVSCGAPGSTNQGDKNSTIIALVTIITRSRWRLKRLLAEYTP